MGMRDLMLLRIVRLFLQKWRNLSSKSIWYSFNLMSDKIYSLWLEYDDQTLEPIEPKLVLGEKLHVPVLHNEVIFWPND